MNMTEEKERAIQNILSLGLQKPKSMWSFLYEMLRSLGFRYIFWDMAQMLLIVTMAFGGFLLLLLFDPGESAYSNTFMLSPLLFLIIMACSEIMERMGGLYELKSVCKYSARQVTALRVLCFSILCAALCVFAAGACAQNSGVLALLPVALCGLFLCAFLTLFIGRVARKAAPAIVCAAWAVFTVLPAIIFNQAWEDFLIRVPAAIILCAAFVFAALFILEIRRLLLKKEDFTHAFGSSRY